MRKEAWLIISGVSFILLVYFLSLLLADKFQVSSCGCPQVISRNFVFIFIALAIIFVASLIYYLVCFRIDTQRKIITKNTSLILSFLDGEEKKALQEIVKANGAILQKELTKKFGKLQAHRLIKRLEEKGIIKTEKEGATKHIKLNKELAQELIR